MLVDKKSGELFLYGVVGPAAMGGDFDEQDVIAALGALGGKRAIVRVNSPGGHVDTGIGILNALRRYAPGTDTINDSLAGSIASIIMLAGEKRTSTEGSRWMIHRARAGVQDMVTAASLRQLLSHIEAYDVSIVELYSQYMSKSPEEIGALLDAETWLQASEAVAAGLSTNREGKTVQKPRMAAWFKNAPQDFIAACADEPVVDLKPFPVLRQAAQCKLKLYTSAGVR